MRLFAFVSLTFCVTLLHDDNYNNNEIDAVLILFRRPFFGGYFIEADCAKPCDNEAEQAKKYLGICVPPNIKPPFTVHSVGSGIQFCHQPIARKQKQNSHHPRHSIMALLLSMYYCFFLAFIFPYVWFTIITFLLKCIELSN